MKITKFRKIVSSLSAVVLFCQVVVCNTMAEVIKLKDGRITEGTITRVNRGTIYFKDKNTDKAMKVKKNKVETIDAYPMDQWKWQKEEKQTKAGEENAEIKRKYSDKDLSSRTRQGKSKLVWGIILFVSGIASAAYGLSNETEIKNVDQVVVNPTDIIFSNSLTKSFTYDGLGRYDTYTEASSCINASGKNISNVVISVTASSSPSGQGTVYGTKTATISSMTPNSSANYSATVDLSPNAYSFYASSKVSQYTISSTKEENKQKAPVIGYVGVGAAAVGTVMCISYLIKQKHQQQAANFDIKPTFYADAKGYYQGMTATWHF